MEQISGYIERLTFHNHENGYTIAQLKQKFGIELVCIVGILPGIQPGETVRCFGQWKNHLVHGRQFEVNNFQIEAPADLIGIRKYLGSGLIKGIGPRYANRIVELFGIETLNIIENAPDKLLQIEGIGPKRIEKIKTCWQDQRSIRDVMIFLQSYGLSPAFAQKIFKKYGQQSISQVQKNPYALARDIFGVGFKSADLLAQKMGVGVDSPQRLDAGIEYTLLELAGDGHVCYPVDELIIAVENTLEVSQGIIQERIPFLKEEGRLEVKEIIVSGSSRLYAWLISSYFSEIGIVKELRRLKIENSTIRTIDAERALKWVQEQLTIELADKQLQAITAAISEKILIITGGPGTGKSTITNAILAITMKLTSKVFLVAPTGRAAKRMSEITKHHASTIHSLLEFDFKAGKFKRDHKSPLDCDLIIVDEASMIDTFLMYSLLKGLPSTARIVFVGDINQLPSVGPGCVLKDMISSLCLPVVILNEIFRQAAGSYIVTNAHRINSGLFPRLHNGKESDFFFMEVNENQDIANTIVKLVAQRLPHRYGFNPHIDIQVLAPMKKGVIGTENLNQMLQQTLNPQEKALIRYGQKIQVGDKVMQIRNNYKREVFNGDIGFVQTIDVSEQNVVVLFDGRAVSYDYADLDELVLAYAVSIHKFQGSECLCVVIPVHSSHFMLLNRNLLYTAVTRGKKLVVLVGTKKALAMAVKKDDMQKRHTSLQQMLMEWL